MKSQKGVTLVSLIITIIIILIIAGTTVYTSTNRFKINNLSKMYNDIELLNDKIATYYLKFGGLPIVKNTENIPINYTFSQLDFDKNINDDENYYIVDLEAIGNITLNYGKDGFKNTNASDDVYIINNKTHTVYYVKGIEYTDGKWYHSKTIENNTNQDIVPPTKPQINIIAGEVYDMDYSENNIPIYTSDVKIEIIPGKDGISKDTITHYMITRINSKEEQTQEVGILEDNKIIIKQSGSYIVTAYSEDENGNISDTQELKFDSIKNYTKAEYLESDSNQFILLRTVVPDDNLTTEITFQLTNIDFDFSNNNRFVIAKFENNNKRYRPIKITRDKQFQIQNSDASNLYVKNIDTEKHNVIFNTQNNYSKFDLTSINKSVIATSLTNHNQIGLGLFAQAHYNHGNEQAGDKETGVPCRIFEVKFTSIGKKYIGNFLPYLDDNGEPCMYDFISRKTFYNQGTGTFKTNFDE